MSETRSSSPKPAPPSAQNGQNAQILTPSLDKWLNDSLERINKNKLTKMFPDTGPYRRELYPKHMEFCDATLEHDQILFLAANKIGKTTLGAYICAIFMTGRYPHWWKGRRFDRPTVGWACNKTATDTRDINQFELLGAPGQMGTGMIPADNILRVKSKPNVPDGVELVYARHKSGGESMLHLKSYDQGREKFQGRNVDFIWNDEEVPMEVYTEEVMRIMTTGGLIMCTYTPVLGLTLVTTTFLRDSVNKDSLPIKFNT